MHTCSFCQSAMTRGTLLTTPSGAVLCRLCISLLNVSLYTRRFELRFGGWQGFVLKPSLVAAIPPWLAREQQVVPLTKGTDGVLVFVGSTWELDSVAARQLREHNGELPFRYIAWPRRGDLVATLARYYRSQDEEPAAVPPDTEARCHFCGLNDGDVEVLVVRSEASICSQCLDLANLIACESLQKELVDSTGELSLHPSLLGLVSVANARGYLTVPLFRDEAGVILGGSDWKHAESIVGTVRSELRSEKVGFIYFEESKFVEAVIARYYSAE